MLWIKVSTELPRNAKLYKLARRLKITRREALAYVVQLWAFVLTNYPDGEINATADEIAFAVELDDSISAQDFVEALSNCAAPNGGFLDKVGGNCYRVHDWEQYSGALSVTRDQNRERQRRFREKKKMGALQETEDEISAEPDSRGDNGEITMESQQSNALRNDEITLQNKNKNKNKNKNNLKPEGRVSENSPDPGAQFYFDEWVQSQYDIIREVVEAPKPGKLPELLAQWRETYGAQTVEETVAKAMRWLQDNGRRYKDMGRFIGRWLARDAESPRAVARRTGQSVPDYGDTLPDWNDLLGGERNEA